MSAPTIAARAALGLLRAGRMGWIQRLIAAGFAAAILATPRVALACAVCTAGRDDESNAAFLVSTIFLSLLPLIALGTFVYVLWRRFQKLEQAGAASDVAPLSSSISSLSAPSARSSAEPSGARS